MCYRYELKYPMDLNDLHQFYYWLKQQGMFFKKQYPGRRVNSLYFDSPDIKNYHDNQAGFMHRMKNRLRWYGDGETHRDLFFEIKKRKNGLGCKQVQKISASVLPLQPMQDLFYRIRARLEPAIRVQTTPLNRPVVFNRYWREYYATSDNIRLTIDTNLEHGVVTNSQRLSSKLKKSSIAAVVEMKYDPLQQERVKNYLHNFPFRVYKNSKYTSALDGN
jgi:VTC domain